MEGCGPCMTTRPEWKKIKSVLDKNFSDRNDIIIVDIDTDVLDDVKYIKSKPNSFPTIRFITNKGDTVENYEDSGVSDDNKRTIDSFVEWIKLKTGENNITISEMMPIKSKKIKGGNSKRSKRYKTSKRSKKCKNSKHNKKNITKRKI
jgi:thiol-disulfide isomerase/thioredoxin